MKKPVVWIAVIIGIFCIALAIYYWMTPAGSLPHFLPGYAAGVTAAHFKHGLAALIVGIAMLIFAWFQSAPKKVG
jgi:uncharacterized membrane protein